MPAFVRNHAVTLLVFAVSLVLSWLLLARLAAADIDAGQMVPVATVEPLDAGQALPPAPAIDRVVAADHAPPSLAPAPPPVEPATIGEGADLASWIWSRFRNGQAGAGLIVLLQAVGLFAIRRWAWVSQRLPRLMRPKALAAVSSFTGALATLVPIAIAGAPIATPLIGAVLAAIGVYLYPAPVQIAGQTVPSGEAVPT